MKKITILYITESGLKLAERLKSVLPKTEIIRYVSGVVPGLWADNDALVFIMASGIVVRTIAPLLKDKKTDPAIVVLDEAGRFAVSLAGGHLGGANELAQEIAQFLGTEAVVTTASDVNDLTSLDLWAQEHDYVVEDWSILPMVGTRFVNNGALRVYSDINMDLPEDFLRVAAPRFADVIITNRKNAYGETPVGAAEGDNCTFETCRVKGQLYLRPRNLVVGIGCNSGTPQEEIERTVQQTLEENNLSFLSIGSVATIDIKGDEPGLRAFVEKHHLPLNVFRADELNAVKGIIASDVVFQATGAFGVAEPAALLAAGANRLLVPKQKKGNVTVAIAEVKVQSTEF